MKDGRWRQEQLPADLQVPLQWEQLAEQARTGWQRVVIIGGTDVGKSTLCWWLAEQLAPQGRVAVVDADVGQSRCPRLAEMTLGTAPGVVLGGE